MYKIFSERAPVFGKVAYKGIAGESKPMKLEQLKPTGMKVGIFLSGATNVSGVETQIEDLIQNFAPSQILIRLHPNSLVNANIDHLVKKYNHLKLTFGTPLKEDLAQVDFIIVGNSGVLLEVLKAGTPCVYSSTLENLDFDYNGFVTAKIVPYWKAGSQLTVKLITDFYTQGWTQSFRQYDPYYLTDQNPEEIVRQEITNLLTLAK